MGHGTGKVAEFLIENSWSVSKKKKGMCDK
jgi:hypothetical protein